MVTIANTISCTKPRRFNSTLSLLCSAEGAYFLENSTMCTKKKGIKKTKGYIDLRRFVRKAILDGTLKKPKVCPMCGRPGLKINGHHEDYSKPLEVDWGCNRCHLRVIHCNRPFEDDLPTSKQHKRKSFDYTDCSQIVFGNKNHHIPVLKEESCQLGGLLFESNIVDEHQYFADEYNWKELMKNLSFREREIIILRYGIDGDYDYTLEEVGRILKVTSERIRQIEIKAIRKLRNLVK